MSLNRNVLIIGGTGWIGSACARRFLDTGLLAQDRLFIANRSGERGVFSNYPDVTVGTDTHALALDADIIILAVRPPVFPTLQLALKDQLVISMMAGVSINQIHNQIKASRIIRAMPNAACELGQSFTPYIFNEAVHEMDLVDCTQLLDAIGQHEPVHSEDALGFLTALSGSAPGMLTFYAHAYVNAALDYGFDREMAEAMVRQVFAGSSAFIQHDPESPTQAMQTMLDYNGSTAAGIRTLLQGDIEKIIKASIFDSYEMAKSDMTKA